MEPQEVSQTGSSTDKQKKTCEKCGGPVVHHTYSPSQTRCVNPKCQHTSYIVPPRVTEPRGQRGPVIG